MKVCSQCGAVYEARVEFCFKDGNPLQAAPEAAPEVAPPPPPAPIKFMIVGGAFSVKDNARKLAADLKTQGFETSLHVQANNGLTVVSMGGYATEADARVALQTARSQGHEKAWMKRL